MYNTTEPKVNEICLHALNPTFFNSLINSLEDGNALTDSGRYEYAR